MQTIKFSAKTNQKSITPLVAKKSFLAAEYKQSEFKDARVVILPIPYERTTSYGKGAKNGPQAIINASQYLETYDEELKNEPCKIGITTLNPLVLKDPSEEKCMRTIETVTRELIAKGKKVVSIGGEHSISAPLALAHDVYSDLTVLQFDAHADLRNSYKGSKRSHGAVMRRISEKLPCVQVGIRSISAEEAKEVSGINTKIFFAHEMSQTGNWMNEALRSLSANVYVTFDVDVFDASIMPATGTPEPGGMDWQTIIRFMRLVAAKRKIVGADIVELSPIKNFTAPDFVTAKLVYKIISLMQ
jgi:agmatinase